MKKIIYVTGTRAEFGVMQDLLLSLTKTGLFDVSVIATGMHLSTLHGHTIDEIKKSGIKIAGEVDMHVEDSTNSGMAKGLGSAIIGLTDILIREQPNLVMVAGDRGEALAGAIVAAHLNIPVAHISGGDTTTGATIDERIRHAITKFSDIHLPANEKSAAVIRSLGESESLIFPVGNPGVSTKYSLTEERRHALIEKYILDTAAPILLVTQHPVTTQPQNAGREMEETVKALDELKLQVVLIYPNADAGSDDMIKVIEEYKDRPYLRIYKSIPREDFIGLMSMASVMVGNSSAALIEAPSFGLPAVNIGERQGGRERAKNVIDTPHEKEKIIAAVQMALSPGFKDTLTGLVNPYAKDNADEKIIEILKNLDLTPNIFKEKGTPHAL